MDCIRCHVEPASSTPFLCELCFGSITRDKFRRTYGSHPDLRAPGAFEGALLHYQHQLTDLTYTATLRIEQGLLPQEAQAPLLPDA